MNPEGFIKSSSILEENMADSKMLDRMINKLRLNTHVSAKKALFILVEGITTEEYLASIKPKGYDYQSVSCTNMKSINGHQMGNGSTFDPSMRMYHYQ